MNTEKTVHDLLRLMLAKKASDLFLTAGGFKKSARPDTSMDITQWPLGVGI